MGFWAGFAIGAAVVTVCLVLVVLAVIVVGMLSGGHEWDE